MQVILQQAVKQLASIFLQLWLAFRDQEFKQIKLVMLCLLFNFKKRLSRYSQSRQSNFFMKSYYLIQLDGQVSLTSRFTFKLLNSICQLQANIPQAQLVFQMRYKSQEIRGQMLPIILEYHESFLNSFQQKSYFSHLKIKQNVLSNLNHFQFIQVLTKTPKQYKSQKDKELYNIKWKDHKRNLKQILNSFIVGQTQFVMQLKSILISIKKYKRMLMLFCLVLKSKWTKSSKLPGMKDICKKDIFARIVNRNQKYFPEVFSKLTPQTFILPEDLDALKQRAKSKKKFFIVKPSGGAQGEGILIVSGMRDIEKYAQGDRIVQSYLAKPLLLYNKKFDLRVYTIIVNTTPISCFLCREGLARFATKEYIPPGQTTRLDYFMHLTNYSLNKRSEDFVMTEEIALANEASKQTMTSLFAGLQAEGYDTQAIWSNITQAVSSMVSTIVPFITIESQLRKTQFGQNKLFQVIGVDVILDRKLNAYVLEINNNPSLAIYYEHELIKEKQINQVDQFIKYQVIKDSFKLLSMTKEEILGTSLLKYSDRIQVEPNIDLVSALQLFVNIQGIKQTPYLTGGKFQKLFSILNLRENGIQKPDLDIIYSMIQSRFGVMDIHSFLDALEILGGKILNNREARGIEKILAVLSKQI